MKLVRPPEAQHRRKTKADIVFCIDSTGSMLNCINAVKDGILTFVQGLQSAALVDFRLRLIGYRDLHDPTWSVPWSVGEFTDSVEEFRQQLGAIKAEGGGEHRGAESTLDALYIAITKSEWRSSQTHRTIILLTDDDTWPNLHPSTYHPIRKDNNIDVVKQEFQRMPHALLFIVAPKFPAYIELLAAMKDARRKVVAKLVPTDEEQHVGLKTVTWEPLLKMLGETVSTETVTALEDDQ